MGIENFGVLKGRASALALDDDSSPHIEIRIEAAGTSYRIAVNARSKVAPHDLLYGLITPFEHPMTEALKDLPEGVTDINTHGGMARPDLVIDYVRGGLISREDMDIAPFEASGVDNDLRDFIEPIVEEGIEDDSVIFYAFGSTWGPEPGRPDKYFDFTPGNGIHNIHMNQGSKGGFQQTNGPNQDGALLVHFTEDDIWFAIFLAFQSQSWNTDPVTGDALDMSRPGGGVIDSTRRPQDKLSASVRIVAALINPANPEEGKESVTLVNRTDAMLSLDGWQIADRNDRRQSLSGELGAGAFKTVILEIADNGPRLRNKGGDIVLIAPDNIVVDRVGYGKSETANEGWTTVF